MKKFLFILLIVIITSKKYEENKKTATNEVKLDGFDKFKSELSEDVKEAYTWLLNNRYFDYVKNNLLENQVKEAKKYCELYVKKPTKCKEFITKYNKFLKEN